MATLDLLDEVLADVCFKYCLFGFNHPLFSFIYLYSEYRFPIHIFEVNNVITRSLT